MLLLLSLLLPSFGQMLGALCPCSHNSAQLVLVLYFARLLYKCTLRVVLPVHLHLLLLLLLLLL
jgi:hypothetical protein